MFLSSCLLLVPMILATEIEVHINNYVIKVERDDLKTLKTIEVIGDPSEKHQRREELNFSEWDLHAINNNVFDNVTHIKILNLSYNLLPRLLENTFANLTNLEQLNLSHNHIETLEKPFVGLCNLKVLDLSNNPIQKLQTSDFFGLTKSCVILLKGDLINTMSTKLFEDESRTVNFLEENEAHRLLDENIDFYESYNRIKICINGTKLISVEDYTEGEKLAIGCNADRSYAGGVLSLDSLSIVELHKGWYKLGDSPIHQIDLSFNNVTHVTSQMLNDLPERISRVTIGHNNIKRLEKGIIVNLHLREISLTQNSIVEIEDDVFINTNLTTLTLSYNQLADTKFVATLPSTLTKIDLEYNEIAEISRESFSKLNKLEYLGLKENNIMMIHKDSLRGLSGLKHLNLMNNRLEKIEAGSFEDLTALEVLNLESNNITELESGLFADLKNIKEIVLGSNSLSNLTRVSLINLPDSLEVLDLQWNDLKILKSGTFVNTPKYKLLLNNNLISTIEAGSFDLPHLQHLVLSNNYLTVIDTGRFQGLKNLQSLRLDVNFIRRIEKGAFETLGNLCELDMSYNSIGRLKNGVFHGLLQEAGCYVELKHVPIEMIHGGVFASNVSSSSDRLPVSTT